MATQNTNHTKELKDFTPKETVAIRWHLAPAVAQGDDGVQHLAHLAAQQQFGGTLNQIAGISSWLKIRAEHVLAELGIPTNDKLKPLLLIKAVVDQHRESEPIVLFAQPLASRFNCTVKEAGTAMQRFTQALDTSEPNPSRRHRVAAQLATIAPAAAQVTTEDFGFSRVSEPEMLKFMVDGLRYQFRASPLSREGQASRELLKFEPEILRDLATRYIDLLCAGLRPPELERLRDTVLSQPRNDESGSHRTLQFDALNLRLLTSGLIQVQNDFGRKSLVVPDPLVKVYFLSVAHKQLKTDSYAYPELQRVESALCQAIFELVSAPTTK